MSNLGTLTAYINGDTTGILRATRIATLSVRKMSADISRSLSSAGKKVQKFGRTMTLGLTVPILAAGAGMVKLASDAEETTNKFNVTFRSVSAEANKMADNLARSYGISHLESKKLLSDTGDLLTGFGFTGKAALDVSTRVNKLAVDLASFTNIQGGSQRASAALTKALLGERESVKELGIAILDSDVKAKVLEMRQKGVTFATERQAKAYATLQIAMEQSKNAIGDFQRSSTSLANQVRILKARLSDIIVGMGNFLLPVVNKLVGALIRLTERFSKLSMKTKIAIIFVAGFAAVLGPAVILLGLFISSAGTLIGAFASLAGAFAFLLSPIGLVIAIVAGAIVAFIHFRDQIMTSANFFAKAARFMIQKVKSLKLLALAAEIIGKAWVGLKVVFFGVISGIQRLLARMAQGFAKVLKGALILANTFGSGLPSAVSDAIVAFNGLSSTLDGLADNSMQRAVDVSEQWSNAFDSLKLDLSTLKSAAGNAFGGVVEAIKGKLTALQSVMTNTLGIGGAPAITGVGGAPADVGPGSVAESDRLKASSKAWSDWLAVNATTAKNYKALWQETTLTVANSFADGFADVITSGKSFGSMIMGVMSGVASALISQSVKTAIVMIGIDQTKTAANAAAAAPHPFLIPLFVGLALAAFASAIGKTKGAAKVGAGVSGGGGGGASSSIESDVGSTVDLTVVLEGGTKVLTPEEQAQQIIDVTQEVLLATGGNFGRVKVMTEEV